MNEPKYKVGDLVDVIHPTFGTWKGTVLHVKDVGMSGEPDWEYEVSNAPSLSGIPLLAWESEITIAT